MFLFSFPYLYEDKLSGNSNVNSRQKTAQDFLNSIDQTGELLAMFEDDEIDEVKQERMEVQYILTFYSYRITIAMSMLFMFFSCCLKCPCPCFHV